MRCPVSISDARIQSPKVNSYRSSVAVLDDLCATVTATKDRVEFRFRITDALYGSPSIIVSSTARTQCNVIEVSRCQPSNTEVAETI